MFDEQLFGDMNLVDESAVSLRFWGDSLVPAVVTEALGLNPHTAFTKGESTAPGLSPTQPAGMWMYWAKVGRSETALETQILELFERLPQDLSVWQQLNSELSSGLFCGLWLYQPEALQSLSAPTLLHIAQRGLSLHSQICFEPIDG